ncbi:hypothetical protein [Amycolatopsis nigrescens]|uniref:hypothetical protein n=1 Tax=Amycolatopsis nigrescens TaxID=381445 RepID=UPI000372CD37|nr:hypothetical protein [Amycolatopsis nigrescens]
MRQRRAYRWAAPVALCGALLIFVALVSIENTYTFDGKDVGAGDTCVTWDGPPALGGHQVLEQTGKCENVGTLKDTHAVLRVSLVASGAAMILLAVAGALRRAYA